MIVADGEVFEKDRIVVVKSLGGDGGVEAEEREAAGPDGAEGVAAACDVVKGGFRRDFGDVAISPALNLLVPLVGDEAADGGGGVDDGDGGG